MKRFTVVAALMVLQCGLTQASSLFFDDFNGGRSSSWTLLREDASLYSYTSTYLDLQCSPGTLTFGFNNDRNVFLINNPATGDFTVTMAVSHFDPLHLPYHQIGLLAYDDDDNYARAIYGSVYRNDEQGLQHGLQFVSEVGSLPASDSETSVDFSGANFYLRLAKTGWEYSQYYSYDGGTWVQVNGPVYYGDGTPAKLGFTASDGSGGESRARIDWFLVEGSQGTGEGGGATPELSSAALLAAGTFPLGLAWLRRRRTWA